jgi:lipopolysaccharide biosynthesis regulator YciM
VSDTALLAVLLAGIAGVLAGRAWAAARRRGGPRDRSSGRGSPHYVQGLHYMAAGQLELAVSELTKVLRADPDAVEVQLVLGNLLREAGQMEKAIQAHQQLLSRADLARSERAHVLACLGSDFRKAGFLDRALRAFEEVLELDPKSIHAIHGLQKLREDQREWQKAYDAQTRLSRLRKTDDSLVLGHLQAEIGQEAARAGRRADAEAAFRTALSLDRRVFPAHLGLADLVAEADPRRAAAILEEAIQVSPERAYLAFDRLDRLYAAAGEASRFGALCEGIIRQDPHEWRARLALSRRLRADGQGKEAWGLVLRALESNPQVLLLHAEAWRALGDRAAEPGLVQEYVRTAEASLFYRDPHICTACRYRADDMLWRCPHCHEWNTFVEERVGLTAGAR